MHVGGRVMHVFSFSRTLACRLMIVFFFKLFLSAANQRDPSNSSVGPACLLPLFSRHSSLPLSHVFESGIFFFVSERQVKHFSGRHCSQSLNVISFFSCFVCACCVEFQTLDRKIQKTPSFHPACFFFTPCSRVAGLCVAVRLVVLGPV